MDSTTIKQHFNQQLRDMQNKGEITGYTVSSTGAGNIVINIYPNPTTQLTIPYTDTTTT